MHDRTSSTAVEQLRALAQSLVRLHKTLMESEREEYEQVFGAIPSANEYLRLVLNDPWFGWLRSLSQLMSEIDEALDAKDTPLTDPGARRLIDQTRTLLVPSEQGEGFGKEYFDALQRDPDVIMAHAEVVKLIAA